jgi:hypothetical protein
VKASDNASSPLSTTQTITINVTDVNEAPTGITFTANSLPSGSAPLATGTTLGKVAGVDPDQTPQTFTYTLVSGTGGADNAKFTLNASTGAITAATSLARKTTFTILVRVTDQNGLSFTKSITIVT